MSVFSLKVDQRTPIFQIVALAGMVLTIYIIITDRTLLLILALAVGYFLIFSLSRPLPAVLLSLLVLSGFLGFQGDLSQGIRPLPGIYISIEDMAVIFLFTVGVIRLYRTGERLLFLRPLLFFGGVVGLSIAFSLVSGLTDLDTVKNGIRVLSGYALYVGLAGSIDSVRNLQWVLRLIYGIAVLSVGIQIFEAISGYRLTLEFLSGRGYEHLMTTLADGRVVNYIWNRSTYWLLICFFFGLAGVLWTGKRRFFALASVSMLGFIIAMVRQWFGYVALAIIILLSLYSIQRRHLKGTVRKGTIRFLIWAGLLIALLIFLSPRIPLFPLVNTFFARMNDIAHFQEQNHYFVRTDIQREQWGFTLESPVFGHGPGARQGFIGVNSDVGYSNTLIQFGLLGLFAVSIMIWSFFRRGYHLLSSLTTREGQAYAAGLLATWAAIAAAYCFGQDSFTMGAINVGLVMALLDRLWAFSSKEHPAESFSTDTEVTLKEKGEEINLATSSMKNT